MFDNINTAESAEIHQNHTDNTDDKTAPHLCDDGRIMTCVITRNVKYHQNMTLHCVNPGGHNRARKVDAGLP